MRLSAFSLSRLTDLCLGTFGCQTIEARTWPCQNWRWALIRMWAALYTRPCLFSLYSMDPVSILLIRVPGYKVASAHKCGGPLIKHEI